tara:strand:+ start:275 stop:550 length:276 start_codon:yes stop_codon:yes gene_type:complete
MVDMILQLILGLPVALFLFSWSTYNLYHGGVFVKQKGWKTKEEWPITFWISVLLPYLFAALAVWGIIDPDGLWSFVKFVLGPLEFFGIATP